MIIKLIKFWIISFVVFTTLDLLWIGVLARDFYQESIGAFMTTELKWGAAIAFYVLYMIGISVFAVLPAHENQSWKLALIYGALFGLVCYATYDLTNLATMKDWPLRMVIYDLIWGTVATAITSIVTFWIGTYWWK